MNVVHFRPPETFKRFGIDWTRDATSDPERSLREAFLTYESSCGPDGLVSTLLLAIVSRRQGAVAEDLQAAADLAEIILAMKLRKHQDDTLEMVQAYLAQGGSVWSRFATDCQFRCATQNRTFQEWIPMIGQPLSAFMRTANEERGQRIIDDHERLVLNECARIAFLTALANPPLPNDRLVALVDRYAREVTSRS